MVNNQSSSLQTNSFPDPWEANKTPESAHPWHFEPEAHPLISSAEAPEGLLAQAGEPNAPQLLPHPSEPEAVQVLLQDELKIPANQGNLRDRIRDALALLWWKVTGNRGSA